MARYLFPRWSNKVLPILIFWVEHKVTQRVRRENPELAPAGTASLGV